MNKVSKLIVKRAERLNNVQKYLYGRIEELQDHNLEYVSRGSNEEEWIIKKDCSPDELAEVACNIALIEELQRIEKLCTK